MKSAIIALGAVAALALATAGEVSAAAGCDHRGHTVAANRYLRVYYVRKPVDTLRLYSVCNLRRGTARALTDDFEGDQRRPLLALSRWRVAFEDVVCDDKEGFCSGSVLRYDVRRDRFRLIGQWDRQAPATDLVISRTGAVAWIRVVAVGVRHVVVADTAGERVLEAGASIEPGSLAVSARHVYWTSGGQPRSALLD